MKKVIIFLAISIIPFIIWFKYKPDYNYLCQYWWKNYEGYPFAGDVLNFDNGYFTLQNDTIYKQNQPCAIIVTLGLSKVKIRSLDGKQTAVYSNKRFD